MKFCVFIEVLLSLRHKYKTLMDTSILLEILRDQREELDTIEEALHRYREEQKAKRRRQGLRLH